MQIVTNETLVKRNRKFATILFVFSMIILGIGFFVANGSLLGFNTIESTDPALYMLCMPAVLLVGFAATLASVRMTNLWLRPPHPEDAIQENLKGLSNKSRLYNYYHFPARHVLICPQGIFVIVTRFQDGRFAVKDDKWKTHRSFIGRTFSLFRLDGLGNPTRDALQAAEFIRNITEGYDPDLMVQPLIMFISPRAEVEIEDSTVPVLYADPKTKPNLKEHLRDIQKAKNMQGPKDLEDFIEEFEAATLEY
jgi:hypothetical protein